MGLLAMICSLMSCNAQNQGFESLSVEDYAKAVTTNNQKDSEIKTEDVLTYFTYTSNLNGKTYFYIATMYKSNDAFWLFNFACDSSNQEKFESTFKTWAKSVSFE